MICPVEIASDMSALQAARVGAMEGMVSSTQAAVGARDAGVGSADDSRLLAAARAASGQQTDEVVKALRRPPDSTQSGPQGIE
jgi:hypothetical protein